VRAGRSVPQRQIAPLGVWGPVGGHSDGGPGDLLAGDEDAKHGKDSRWSQRIRGGNPRRRRQPLGAAAVRPEPGGDGPRASAVHPWPTTGSRPGGTVAATILAGW
jgi:hypothetical protein